MDTSLSRFATLVAATKPHIQEISLQQAKAALATATPPLLIDIREDHEWQAGHLPQAIHIGKGVIERDIEKAAPDTATPMILYCGGGSRSALAAEALQKMGYTQVLSMDGGFRGWLANGYPVQTTAT